MGIISKEETLNRIAEFGISTDSTESLFKGYPFTIGYLLPIDTGKKTFLTQALVDTLEKSPGGLMWVTGHGVWKSAENIDLFNGYRKSLGETRSLNDAPGHVFDETDTSSIRSLLSLALYFYWDVLVLEGSGQAGIEFSHDEYVNFYAKDADRLRKFEDLAKKLEMKRITD